MNLRINDEAPCKIIGLSVDPVSKPWPVGGGIRR